MGGVFSQQEGFTRLGDLWGLLAFHAVVTAVGAALAGKGFGAKQVAA